MILTNASAQRHILPIYGFLAVWSMALGIAHIHLWKTLFNLGKVAKLDRDILTAIESTRRAFRFCIYVEIGFAVGVWFLYAAALLFVVGGIVIQIRFFSENRDALAWLEESVERTFP
jgi:hypothetical protein